MTEAEELELLQLKAKQSAFAQAAPELQAAVAPEQTPTLDAMGTGLQHFGRHIAGGLGDKITAAMQAAGDVWHDKKGDVSFGDAYNRDLAFLDKTMEASDKAHPVARWVGNVPGAVGSALALGGAGEGLLGAMGVGAGYGAAGGFGSSRATDLKGALKDTLAGGVIGAAGGAVARGMGSLLTKAVRGVIRPGATAETLRELGVDTSKLTLGQMNPEGAMAQIEEAGQHAIGSGNVIRGQREAGLKAWRDAVLNRSTAPYQPLTGGSATEQLDAANRGFRTAYDAVGENPIATAGPGQQSVGDQLRRAFGQAVDNPNVLSTDADRAGVGRYLDNQASALRFTPGETRTVGDLQGVRSDIRHVLKQALGGASPDYARAQMLRDAESAVTGQIEHSLPESERAALRAIDARYASHKTIEDAVRRAGDSQAMQSAVSDEVSKATHSASTSNVGLMPQHLSAAIKAATERGSYARGAGGDLRELAVAGAKALQAKTPPTGARALMQLIPGSHYVQAPLAAMANMSPVKNALLGQTAAQEHVQALIAALRNMPKTERALGALGGATEREASLLPAQLQPMGYRE